MSLQEKRKKRILWCGEASYLASGFSTYSNEVLKILHATGKYEITELGSFGDASDPNDTRWKEVPWPFIPVKPNRYNKEECEFYDSRPLAKFGEWQFERACLTSIPDAVCDERDWWMFEHQERSVFRPFYHWSICPTVDAAPQDEQWITTFCNADAVFTNTDWAIEVLKSQAPRINIRGKTPPGADTSVLKPNPDRKALRRSIGVDENCFIVGTVMRNQGRKLFPELFKAFAKFLSVAPPEMAKKTFLYCHTSYPDSWDIPRLLKNTGIGHKVIFTYLCRQCKFSWPRYFADAKTDCPRCGARKGTLPNTQHGVSRETLAEVYNLFDVYCQMANSEGLGMPAVEAASCGIPVMETDYSAMADVVRKVHGIPIKVLAMTTEWPTHCERAIPDPDDFITKLIDILSQPEAIRRRMGFEARQGVEEHFTYKKTAKVWEEHFDSVPIRPFSETWGSPARLHTPNLNIPQGLDDEQFVRWGLVNIAGRPELVDSWVAARMVRDLSFESTTPTMNGLYYNDMSTLGYSRLEFFNRERAIEEMLKHNQYKNEWETKRVNQCR